MMVDDNSPVLVAAVEGGGTTFVVAVAELLPNGTATPKILHSKEIDSSNSSQQTLSECVAFFEQHKPVGGYHALGIASFGPVGVKETNSETYGSILGSSPKANWRNVNILEPLRKACQGSKRKLMVKMDTDVNAPALAEFLLEEGISSLAYVTVGTGVGVGLVINGQCVHGMMHPEAGHVPVQPLPNDDFKGYSWGVSSSPFRGIHTVEGVASSVALTERLQQQRGGGGDLDRNILRDLSDDDAIWDHAANALANLCVTLLLTTSMEKIVLGGGVMKRPGLLERIRVQTVKLLNGYLELPSDMSTIIAAPRYGDSVGLMGAVMLAKQSLTGGNDTVASPKKSDLFYHGIWHGMIIGAAATVGVFALMSRRSK